MHEGGAISQAEIDALVRGMTGQAATPPAGNSGGQDDGSLLREPLTAMVQEASRALSELVGAQCHAAVAEVTQTTAENVTNLAPGGFLVGRAELNSALTGQVYFTVPLPLGLTMITHIYGGVAPSALDESALGALADGLTQMNQVGLSRLAEFVGRPVFAGPIEVTSVPALVDAMGGAAATPVVSVVVDLTVGEDSGRLYLVFLQDVLAPLVTAMKERRTAKAQAAPAVAAPAPAYQAPAPAPAPAPAAARPAPQAPAVAAAPSAYQAARFPDLTPRAAVGVEARNIDLLMDVTLQVTVELGRTRKQIRDVLSLGPGSVLELDKLAGEQVDVLVNGKLIAKGEVVVIDENYGVRITDIVSPVERMQSLK